jgi:F-type H+-transporting ATPase subunit delta
MSVLSLRYAHAFASVAAASRLDTTAAQQQLSDFSGTLAGSRELREVLMNPSIATEQKLKVLDAIAGRMACSPRSGTSSPSSYQRLAELNEIITEYHAVADEQSSLADGITCARPLNGRTAGQSRGRQARRRPAALTYHPDATLLGGAIVRIGRRSRRLHQGPVSSCARACERVEFSWKSRKGFQNWLEEGRHGTD